MIDEIALETAAALGDGGAARPRPRRTSSLPPPDGPAEEVTAAEATGEGPAEAGLPSPPPRTSTPPTTATIATPPIAAAAAAGRPKIVRPAAAPAPAPTLAEVFVADRAGWLRVAESSGRWS